jgi:hypothetical protein
MAPGFGGVTQSSHWRGGGWEEGGGFIPASSATGNAVAFQETRLSQALCCYRFGSKRERRITRSSQEAWLGGRMGMKQLGCRMKNNFCK